MAMAAARRWNVPCDRACNEHYMHPHGYQYGTVFREQHTCGTVNHTIILMMASSFAPDEPILEAPPASSGAPMKDRKHFFVFLRSLSRVQVDYLAHLLVAFSAHDIPSVNAPPPQCHDVDAACAHRTRVILREAMNFEPLAFINLWCKLWPRTPSSGDLPADALGEDELATCWSQSRRKYAGCGGGYCATRVTNRESSRSMFACMVSEWISMAKWLVSNTEVPTRTDDDALDAHDAQQWATVLGERISYEDDDSPVSFDCDRRIMWLLQQCPEHLRHAVVAIPAGLVHAPLLVRAHVLGAHQTSGFIQSMFDAAHEYHNILTREWDLDASALLVAATTRRWRMLMELANGFRWRSSAAASAMSHISQERDYLYHVQDGFHHGVEPSLFKCLHESLDATETPADRDRVEHIPPECVSAQMVRDAESQLDAELPGPSYACHVRAMVRFTIDALDSERMRADEPFAHYVPYIDMPTRILLLIHALRTDDCEDVSRVMIQLQLFPSVETCLDTNLVPGRFFPSDCELRWGTGSLLQLCGAHRRETSNKPFRALFGENTDVAGCGRPKLSSGTPFTRQEAVDRLRPWKLAIVEQLIAVRSIRGVAWALKIPAAMPGDDEAVKDAIMRGLVDVDVVYDPLTLEEAVDIPSLALRLAAWGVDPFVGHDGRMSAFEHAVLRVVSDEDQYRQRRQRGSVQAVTLAHDLADAYVRHSGTSMGELLRDGRVRRSFSRAVSTVLHVIRNHNNCGVAVLRSIAPLSRWRVWTCRFGADPEERPRLQKAFDRDALGIVLRAPLRLVPPVADGEYAIENAVSIMHEGGSRIGAVSSVFTTATERGRERAKPVTRWGDVPYQHGNATRAQVIACLAVLSVPAKRWHFNLRR